MTTIKDFVQRQSVLTYFVLTFVITWGSIFLVIGSVGFPITSEQIEAAGPLVYVGMLVGPSVAGLLLTALVDGREGFRALLSRLCRWRVSVRWYGIALLTAPVLIITILFVLLQISPVYYPAIYTAEDKLGLLVMGIVMGLVVGFFEEIGWTGFAVPRIRQRYGIPATGILVGLLWGLWHLPPFSGSIYSSGPIPPFLYLSVLLFSFLPVYRILMVWVFDRTQSLLVVVLMHAPLSASQLILIPPSLSGEHNVTYDLAFTAVLWVVVVIITAIQWKNRSTLNAEMI